MGKDIAGEVADEIGNAKIFGVSENIRHGKYEFLIKRCFSELIENDKGNQKMSFVEVIPLVAEPNPVSEGDHVDYPGTAGPLKDDGRNPNAVGAPCAMKVNHDGPGARSAGTNIKEFLLAVFNKDDSQISPAEVSKTWKDAARRKPCKQGDIIGYDQATNQPIKAEEDKQANPLCGVIVRCTTMSRRKKTPNVKGAYITKLIWSCASPLGEGKNTAELIAKRRAEILANTPIEDDEEEETSAAPSGQPSAPPPPAPPPSPPPPANGSVFTPPAPWEKHPAAPWGTTPETQWYFSNPLKGGTNDVKNAAALKAGL